MENLTLQKLQEMEQGTIFASGIITDPRLHGEPVRWLAKRGRIHDWAIYYHFEHKSLQWVEDFGDKCHTTSVIKDLVPCDDEALKMYRF
jgi:hypothetical protein